MSSSYESYDEEESSRQVVPSVASPEASIELMRDARICAFLLAQEGNGASGPSQRHQGHQAPGECPLLSWEQDGGGVPDARHSEPITSGSFYFS